MNDDDDDNDDKLMMMRYKLFYLGKAHSVNKRSWIRTQ